MGCNCNKNNTQKNTYYSRANTPYRAVAKNVINPAPKVTPKPTTTKAAPKVVSPKPTATRVTTTRSTPGRVTENRALPKAAVPKVTPSKVTTRALPKAPAPKVTPSKVTTTTKSAPKVTSYRSNYPPNGGYATGATYQQYNRKYKPFKKMSQHELRSWDNIHKMAVDASTNELKEEFGRYIEFLRHNFPCPKCRPHIKKYMKLHPIKSYYNITEDGKDVGMAKWSWEFHNDVNKRLFKRQVSWEDFKKKYLN